MTSVLSSRRPRVRCALQACLRSVRQRSLFGQRHSGRGLSSRLFATSLKLHSQRAGFPYGRSHGSGAGRQAGWPASSDFGDAGGLGSRRRRRPGVGRALRASRGGSAQPRVEASAASWSRADSGTGAVHPQLSEHLGGSESFESVLVQVLLARCFSSAF